MWLEPLFALLALWGSETVDFRIISQVWIQPRNTHHFLQIKFSSRFGRQLIARASRDTGCVHLESIAEVGL